MWRSTAREIERNGGSGTAFQGVVLTNVGRATLRDTSIFGSTGAGLHVVANGGAPSDVAADNLEVSGNDDIGVVAFASSSTALTMSLSRSVVAGNVFATPIAGGVAGTSSGGTVDLLVTDCVIRTNAGFGVRASGAGAMVTVNARARSSTMRRMA